MFYGILRTRDKSIRDGVSTNSPCRDINDTTVSSLILSLSAACVLVAIFFIPFFPRHRRENWSWLDHDEIAVFRGREARWWFIVPSRDSLNPSKSGRGLEVFSESRRRNLEGFFYIFTSRSIWMIVLKINIFTIKLSNRSRQGGFVWKQRGGFFLLQKIRFDDNI